LFFHFRCHLFPFDHFFFNETKGRDEQQQQHQQQKRKEKAKVCYRWLFARSKIRVENMNIAPCKSHLRIRVETNVCGGCCYVMKY